MSVIRGEIMNSRVSHLQQARLQAAWYTHSSMTNGHTERGQVLGSVGALGGGAGSMALDRYSPRGRTTVRWDRIVWGVPLSADGLPLSEHADVSHAVGVERARFTRYGELTLTAMIVKEFNRNFGPDATNLNFSASYRLTAKPKVAKTQSPDIK
jgi:hypothetical protein